MATVLSVGRFMCFHQPPQPERPVSTDACAPRIDRFDRD
jgi:hypothetical protein